MIRKALRILLKVTIGIFLLLSAYLLAAVILSYLGTSPEAVTCDEKKEIFTVSNGVHLNIILPVQEIPEGYLEELQIPPGARYLAFGWGDKGFYLQTPTWADLKFSVAFKALFLKSESAMHVTHYATQWDAWIQMEICDLQYKDMLEFIAQSFERNQAGEIQKIPGAGYSDKDSFYEGKGSYTLFYTCNSWVNEALKMARVKTSLWSPFDFGVLYHVRNES